MEVVHEQFVTLTSHVALSWLQVIASARHPIWCHIADLWSFGVIGGVLTILPESSSIDKDCLWQVNPFAMSSVICDLWSIKWPVITTLTMTNDHVNVKETVNEFWF